MGGSKLGEPLIDVIFDDVIENGYSAFMGCEVLPKDRYANGRASGGYVSEHIVKIIALM